MFFIAMSVGMFGVLFIAFIYTIKVLAKITRYASAIFMSIIVRSFSVIFGQRQFRLVTLKEGFDYFS